MSLSNFSSASKYSNLSNLDDDSLYEILKRVVGVKSLCRFRCVCKSWKSLLSSRYFIGDHAAAIATTAEKVHFLCKLSSREVYSDQFAVYRSTEAPFHQRVKFLHFPFRNRFNGSFRIIDVVHGVLCLRSNKSALLWKPLFQKFVRFSIPYESYRNPYYLRSRSVLGFGFDSSKNSFKVVKISFNYHGLDPIVQPKCEVFSLEDQLWRKVRFPDDVVVDYYAVNESSIFMNGSIHWIVGRKSDPGTWFLLLFDCEEEEFRTMDPPEGREILYDKVSLHVFKCCGMLCLLDIWKKDLWVMEEYGVASSWKKLLSIKQLTLEDYSPIIIEDNVVRPPAYDMIFESVDFDFRKRWIKWCLDNGGYYRDKLMLGLPLDENMFFMGESKATSYGKDEVIYLED